MPSCSGLHGIPYSNAIFNFIYKYLQIISAIDSYIKSEPSSPCSLKSVLYPLSVLSSHSLYFYHMKLAWAWEPRLSIRFFHQEIWMGTEDAGKS